MAPRKTTNAQTRKRKRSPGWMECMKKCDYECISSVAREVSECHMCLRQNCHEHVERAKVQSGELWWHPVCQKAVGDANVCWADTSTCVGLANRCYQQGTCWNGVEGPKLDQCWKDYSKRCTAMYAPCDAATR